ncbi:MAG: hypothetical protein HXS48_16800 [Theionarchaea archaeon]|nr:hypothetical protein [Theionarchaea archaeon]
MIDKLPRCLHTCLHCAHAVILEEYSAYSRKLVFDGCWKFNHIRLPVDRGDCERFKESEERVKRNFWKKWQWKIYVDGKLIQHEQPKRVSDEICKQPEKHNDPTCVATNTTSNTDTKDEDLPTRALILQALANNISRLKDIAHFANIHPATAHYHLSNLTREGKVTKVSRGKYSLPESHSFEDGSHFFDKDLTDSSHFFDTFLRDLSLATGDELTNLTLIEKNILTEILSAKNRHEKYSERELSRICNVSRNTIKKYTQKLEKRKLIEIKKEHNQYVYEPTNVVIWVAKLQSLTGAEDKPLVGRSDGCL